MISFQAGDTTVHRLDPRTKQMMVMVLSSACFIGGTLFLGLLSLGVGSVFFHIGKRLIVVFYSLKYLLFFLLFLFVFRSIDINEHLMPVFDAIQAKEAIVFCWRLLLVALLAVLLISTTKAGDIKAALVWLLKPFPFVNERLAATMIGLLLRLLPLVLMQSVEIGEAMRARCVEERRNPAVRLARFTIALFRRVFLRADNLVDAFQARCFHEKRTMVTLRFGLCDLYAAVGSILLLTSVFLD